MHHGFKALAGFVAAAGLAACAPRPETAYGDYLAWRSDLADADCKSGLRLKTTGFCSDDDPALLGATSQHPPPSDHCKWRLTEAAISADLAILLRVTTCRESLRLRGSEYVPDDSRRPGRAFEVYRRSGPATSLPTYELTETAFSDIADIENYVVTFFELPPGQTAQAFVAGWRSPDLRRDLPTPACEIVPRPDMDLAGEAFASASTDQSGSCNDADVWEARPGFALLHDEDGLHPSIDQKSYTFYARGGDGRWARRP